jgi:hypothetical protein
MNLKHFLLTGTLLVTPFWEQANHLPDISLNEYKETVKDEISYVLVSSHIPKDTTSSYALWESISSVLDQEGEVIVRRPTKELLKTPLHMSKVRRDFWAVLGYNQSDSILSHYNDWKTFLSSQKYELLDTLNFPLIYPVLKKYFPQEMSALDSLDAFSTLLVGEELSESAVVVQQVDSGKHALWFYKNNQLVLSTYVSVGKGQSTPTGVFSTKRKIAYCWSNKHDAPMPYGIEFITPKYFFHQWYVDGTPLSHGCIRVPGLYEEVLYALVDQNTSLIISPNLYKKFPLNSAK